MRMRVPLLVFAIFLAGCQKGSEEVDTPAVHPVSFSLKNSDNSEFNLADYRGKPTVLNFWATWCGPCLLEIPELMHLNAEWGDRVNIIGISIDLEGYEVVDPFVAEMGIGYPVVVDTGTAQSAVGGLIGVPNTIVLDEHGYIVSRTNGLVTAELVRSAVEDAGLLD